MRHQFATKMALVAALLGSTALLSGCKPSTSAQAEVPPPTQTVEVTPVLFQALRQWDDVTGHLEAVDHVDLRPRVGGFIESVIFKDGARVHKGDVLFQIDPRPYQAEVDRLTAEVDQARAKAALADADLARSQRLIAQNAISQGDMDTDRAAALSARADVAAAQAALRDAELDLEWTKVTSPIGGRVSRALITAGNLVTTGDILTTVVSDGPIYASFYTDEQTYLDFGALRQDGSSPVYMGLMNEDGFPHKGKLVFIDNELDSGSGTIDGRALFDNKDNSLTPGAFVRVRLLSPQAQTVALVPEEALETDLGQRYVLVLGPDHKLLYRTVTLGPALDELRVIDSGLEPGDQVVVSGLQKVKEGDTVAPQQVALPITADERALLAPARSAS